jgi:hypothetical protein
MQQWRGILRGAAFLTAAFLGGVAGSWLLHPEAPTAGIVELGDGRDKPGITATFGVGGVMTWEGDLWQYRPDKQKWMTLDESFALEGQATKVVPLPVSPENIRRMETFGFLVTRTDDCWLYNIEQQRWEPIGKPLFHARTR